MNVGAAGKNSSPPKMREATRRCPVPSCIRQCSGTHLPLSQTGKPPLGEWSLRKSDTPSQAEPTAACRFRGCVFRGLLPDFAGIRLVCRQKRFWRRLWAWTPCPDLFPAPIQPYLLVFNTPALMRRLGYQGDNTWNIAQRPDWDVRLLGNATMAFAARGWALELG
jgi:hypothetical protein